MISVKIRRKMGGIGSGTGIRPNRKRTKQFVEAFGSIDASSFSFSSMKFLPKKANTYSTQGVTFQIFKDKLVVSQTNSLDHWSYEIHFSLTPAYYGNFRYWFRCPKCDHRRQKLSLIRVDGFSVFLCRYCLNLAYQSQNRTQGDQIIHKKWQLIRNLGCTSEYIPDGAKPRGMHWKTFCILREQILWLHEQAFQFAPLGYG